MYQEWVSVADKCLGGRALKIRLRDANRAASKYALSCTIAVHRGFRRYLRPSLFQGNCREKISPLRMMSFASSEFCRRNDILSLACLASLFA